MFEPAKGLAKNWDAVLYWLILSITIAASVRLYSAWFTPIFSSDNAVHILMAQDFKIPDNLYYWGQDRRGSFEPAIAHFVAQGLSQIGIEPSLFLILSIIQLLLIGLAFWSLSQCLRSRLSRLIFALVWFLPPLWFHDSLLLAQPYYAQFAFLGIGVWGIHQLEQSAGLPEPKLRLGQAQTAGLILLSVLCLFGSVWISELSVFPLVALLARLWAAHASRRRMRAVAVKLPQNSDSPVAAAAPAAWTLLLALCCALVCGLFLGYAKHHAYSIGEYQVLFAQRAEVLETLRRLAARLWPLLTFQSNSHFVSFSLCGLLLFLALLAKPAWHFRPRLSWLQLRSGWTFFWGVSALAAFSFLLLSQWVYLNDTSSRYFIFPFILGALALLRMVEALPQRLSQRALLVLLVLAFSSALSSPTHLLSVKSAQPVRQQLEAFQHLPHQAFIGDYWASYLICSTDPAELACTPHEQSTVRCQSCVSQVLAENRTHVYVIRDRWFERWPETMTQFGRSLVRDGKPQRIGGYTLAPYRIASP